jgi:hypothetical protein
MNSKCPISFSLSFAINGDKLKFIEQSTLRHRSSPFADADFRDAARFSFSFTQPVDNPSNKLDTL